MTEDFLLKMRNILLSYSVRNITVGYCQGMNFFVARLLLIIENEEERLPGCQGIHPIL